MPDSNTPCKVDWVLFDFGGVLAEEGFAQGLREIARQNNLDPELVLQKAKEHIYASGYLLGKGREQDFWHRMRQDPGFTGQENAWRQEILSRFQLRDWMLETVRRIRASGSKVAILSDQVDWLDELNAQNHFFDLFHEVFNSYHLGWSKAVTETFRLVLQKLDCTPNQALFVDDDPGNIHRAEQAGLHCILYQDRQDFMQRLQVYCPAAAI
ncbi:MAG: HAD family phosphatase [Desulfohalobiaceae bacterium]